MARRYDDDDDYDRPRKKKKKKGSSNDERQMAMFCHIGMLLGGFVIPLIIYMTKKDESRFIEKHAREALNFAFSMLIYTLVGGLVTCGIAVLVLSPLSLYFCIMAGMEANQGKMYRYPMCIHFM
jgi:uncharacterized Tic20 family protein